MFPRLNSNNGAATLGASRRAFRDVTNATRGNDDAGTASVKPSLERIVTNPTDNLPAIRVELAAPRQHMHSTRSHSSVNPESYQHSGQVDDIDARDAEDPLCATDYVVDMYDHFREKEFTTSVRPTFMETQTHINERMRSILIDWLVEVHLKFKLVPETLYLTVNIIDRYLEKEEVSRPKLQLVGVTSLLIASKYEEIYPPELRDLVYICDRAYTRNEVS